MAYINIGNKYLSSIKSMFLHEEKKCTEIRSNELPFFSAYSKTKNVLSKVNEILWSWKRIRVKVIVCCAGVYDPQEKLIKAASARKRHISNIQSEKLLKYQCHFLNRSSSLWILFRHFFHTTIVYQSDVDLKIKKYNTEFAFEIFKLYYETSIKFWK